MFILGLTGSIGMGKSTTARMFAERGVPVHDADAVVHDLYAEEAVQLIADAFPAAVVEGRVDRGRLSAEVVGDAEAMARLEAIVHPLVRERERRFLERMRDRSAALAVVEVPLLLETGGGRRVDAVAVVTAPAEVQRTRVLERSDMSEDKLQGILARQMPDAEKREQAHFVIDTGKGLTAARKAVDDICRALAGAAGSSYSRRMRE